MKHLLVIFPIFIISSCSHYFTSKKPDNAQNIIRLNQFKNLSSEEIKVQSSKFLSMAGGNYKISIFPITRSYLNAKLQEQTLLKSLTKKQTASLKQFYNQKYLKNNTCIQIDYTVAVHEKIKNLDNWKLELTDYKNATYKLNWDTESMKNIPIKTLVNRSMGPMPQWSNSGIACVNTNIPIAKSFSVKVTPVFVQWPFSKHTYANWEFDHFTKIDGKKVKIKKSKKSYQSYRGW